MSDEERVPSDMHINIWLEQVVRERKHSPFDSMQVELGTWEAMLREIKRYRAGLSREDVVTLQWLAAHLKVPLMPGVPPRGDKRRAIELLDRLLADDPRRR